jgi:hypothetical protein
MPVLKHLVGVLLPKKINSKSAAHVPIMGIMLTPWEPAVCAQRSGAKNAPKFFKASSC